MGGLVGIGDVAGHLTRVLGAGAHERKHRGRIVARLLGQARIIDRAGIDTWRRAGLEPAHRQVQSAQALGQRVGGAIARAPAAKALVADMDRAAQKGADGENDRTRSKRQPHAGDHAGDVAVLDDQIGHALLKQRQVGLALDKITHRGLVQRAIGLGPRCPYGRALASVQGPKLDPAAIGRAAHHAAQGIDFLDQMALADPADGRVARHLADGFDVVGQQQRPGAAARGRGGTFRTGMAAADDDDIKDIRGLIQGRGCGLVIERHAITPASAYRRSKDIGPGCRKRI